MWKAPRNWISQVQKVTFFKNKYIELHLGEESMKFSWGLNKITAYDVMSFADASPVTQQVSKHSRDVSEPTSFNASFLYWSQKKRWEKFKDTK